MALKTKAVNDFTKMLDANVNRYMLPPGAVPMISNLLGTFPGELTTCDGTRVISAPPATGNQAPIIAIGQVFPIAGQSTTVGLTYGGGIYTLIDMSVSPWTIIGTFTGNPPTFPPQFVVTNSGVAIMTDFTNPIRQWSGVSGAPIETLTNTFNTSSFSNIWTPATDYPPGTLIIPPGGNGYYYMANPGGVSGNSEPSFGTTPGEGMADGLTGLVWVNQGSVTGIAPLGGMHGIYYSGSLWIFGNSAVTDFLSQTGDSALWMSDVQDIQSWNPLNQSFVNEGDGTVAMGLTTMTIVAAGIAPTSALVIFKTMSTFQFQSVFGSSSALLAPAQTNLGCLSPRSIQFQTGVGLIRMTHEGIAVFDGSHDVVISTPIRPYLFGGDPTITPIDWNAVGNGISSLVVNPDLYVIGLPVEGDGGAIRRLFVYDFVLSAQTNTPVWTVIDLPFFISSMAQILTPDGTPMTVLGGYDDGNLRRWQWGDDGWDSSSTPVAWSFETTPVTQDPTERVFVRWLQLRVRNVNGTATVDGYPIISDLPQSGTLGMNFSLTDPAASPQGVYGQSFYGNAFFQGNQQSDLVTISVSRTGYNISMIVKGTGLVRISGMIWRYMDKPAALIGRMC